MAPPAPTPKTIARESTTPFPPPQQPIDAPTSRRRAALGRGLRELPLLLGWFAGIHHLWSASVQVRSTHIPTGSDWHQYIAAAHVIHTPVSDITYPDWRKPLYSYLLGLVGGDGTWVEASIFWGLTAGVVIILASGWAARVLAGPWAGGVAGFTAACVPTVLLGTTWTNLYMMLGATTGLSLAFAASLCRWPRGGWALLLGWVVPITWAVDLRGALVIPIAGAAMLVALASLLQRRAWKQAALVLVLFAAGWGVGSVPAHNLSSLPYRAPERQFDTQRRLTLDQFAHRDDPSFQQACGREWTSREPQVPDHATLASPCSRFVLHQNLSGLQETGTLPPSWVFWLLPLCLLPTRRRWARGSLASVLSFVGPLGALGVFALWVQVPPRYTLQFAVPLAMLAPVALLRVANLIPGRPPWRPWPGRILAAGVALFMALQVWPRATAPDSDPWHDHGLAELASWTTANIGPDDAVLECCAAALETIFLPDELHPGEPNQYGMFQPLCARYVRNPPQVAGNAWLLAGANPLFEAPAPATIAAHGWVREDSYRIGDTSCQLWKLVR